MFDNVTFGFGGGNKSSRKTDARTSASSSLAAEMSGTNFVVDETFVQKLLANNMPGGNADILDLSYKTGDSPSSDTRPKTRIKRFLANAWNNKWVQYAVMGLAAIGAWKLFLKKMLIGKTDMEILREIFPD